LIGEARRLGPVEVAVAAADDLHTLEAVKQGAEAGLVSRAHLFGDGERITAVARSLGFDLAPHDVVETADEETAARLAVGLAYGGEASLLLKGSLPTASLLKAVLAAERARTNHQRRLLSHVAVMEVPTYHKLLLITDAGMIIAPTREEKVQIIRNAQRVAQALGIAVPKVAVLAAVETVNPKMRATVEAHKLAELARAGGFPGLVLDGPLALDVALSAESARYKGLSSPVAGDADIFLVPSIEVGNVLGKAILYLARGRMAGLVAGASVPLPLTSRSETSQGKLFSLALAILYARR
jgi:phosphate butyryltransferase